MHTDGHGIGLQGAMHVHCCCMGEQFGTATHREGQGWALSMPSLILAMVLINAKFDISTKGLSSTKLGGTGRVQLCAPNSQLEKASEHQDCSQGSNLYLKNEGFLKFAS